jgi:hypothetical protein
MHATDFFPKLHNEGKKQKFAKKHNTILAEAFNKTYI